MGDSHNNYINTGSASVYYYCLINYRLFLHFLYHYRMVYVIITLLLLTMFFFESLESGV